MPLDQRGTVIAGFHAALRVPQGSEPMRLPNDDATNGWSAILPPRTARPALRGDGVADWLVLRPHAHIVVVDAGTVGNNASGRNSGFAIDVPHNIGSSLEELRQAAHYQALLTAGLNDLELLATHHRGGQAITPQRRRWHGLHMSR